LLLILTAVDSLDMTVPLIYDRYPRRKRHS
jgi:hypothetical protein